ncbi:hypothetical protein LX36DRAFT_457192 [Colletotrichum falcatum]|nr:hypothetical protein LX36DRAFT_457192 [Colletotrichum falcatum]
MPEPAALLPDLIDAQTQRRKIHPVQVAPAQFQRRKAKASSSGVTFRITPLLLTLSLCFILLRAINMGEVGWRFLILPFPRRALITTRFP